jgi:hypothetical protein
MRARKAILVMLGALIVASVLAATTGVFRRASGPGAGAEPLPDAVVVYCFHPAERCSSCAKIENYTHEVLDKSFAAPLKQGQLVWRVANYESPENAHFADEYQIVSTCIVLVDGRAGRARAWKNLQEQAWELVDNKKAFQDFVRGEIQKALQ